MKRQLASFLRRLAARLQPPGTVRGYYKRWPREFPGQLRAWRSRNRLTLREAGELFGVSHEAVRKWEEEAYGPIEARREAVRRAQACNGESQ